MARRSDHSRDELRALFITEGHKHMAETGFARFSAREVAKRVGYSIGTLYNVFGSLDMFLVAINSRTFTLWADHLRARLDACGEGDRIAALVDGYFEFARRNAHAWMAIYDHRLPPDTLFPAHEHQVRGALTDIVVREIAAVLPGAAPDQVKLLAKSLVATVHGHCDFELSGSFALMSIDNAEAMALARVRECLAAASRIPA